jgi:hypothetical protein
MLAIPEERIVGALWLAVPVLLASLAYGQAPAADAPSRPFPAELPLDFQLWELSRDVQAGSADAQRYTTFGVSPASDGRIRVQLICEHAIDTPTLQALDALGVGTDVVWDRYGAVWVDPAGLVELAGRLPAGCRLEAPARSQPAMTQGEGPDVMGTRPFGDLGARGSGVRIGLIDKGFSGLTAAVARGDAPANYFWQTYGGSELEAGIDHGTCCLEVLFDHAPEATYYLYRLPDSATYADFGTAVDDALADGVQILSHSIGWFNQGWHDNSGPINEAVLRVAGAGVLVCTSAGNSAQTHWQGAFSDADGDNWHDFASGSEVLRFHVPAGNAIHICAQWNTDGGTFDYDLYLYLFGSSLTEIASSENGGNHPESVDWFNNTGDDQVVALTVYRYDGGSTTLEIFTFGAGEWLDPPVPESSGTAPGNCTHPNVLSVGAVWYSLFGAAQGTADIIEPFSSRGPTHDGQTFPVVCGPDGVTTGDGPFFGTSCSAPSVAGAAAVLKSCIPGASNEMLRDILLTLAEFDGDWGAPGHDNIYGWGGLVFPPTSDCNSNHRPDLCEWLSGTLPDCDNDLVPDECESDCNQDGIPDACEPDDDGDGVPDGCDLCPGADDQADADGDGSPDCRDGCPSDPQKSAPGTCGCGVADTDSDADGIADCHDGCPTDPGKVEPGECGCGTPDADSDADGVPNCDDDCPNDPHKTAPGACGCGTPDTDSDRDGVPDCKDGCPNDARKTAPGACGCGASDKDSDGDGTPDCKDDCPNDSARTAPGPCGCGDCPPAAERRAKQRKVALCPLLGMALLSLTTLGMASTRSGRRSRGDHNCYGALALIVAVGLIGLAGCGEALLGLSESLDGLANNLAWAGECLSPWNNIALDDVFNAADRREWMDNALELTGVAQPNVTDSYGAMLSKIVTPDWYSGERMFDLGPIAAGEAITFEFLDDAVGVAALYDADQVLLLQVMQQVSTAVRDYDGALGSLVLPIRRDTAQCYLRVRLTTPGEIADPILRLTRARPPEPAHPKSATVVLHFGGATGVSFPYAYITPCDVSPFDDAVARTAAVAAFRDVFAPFNLAILTDADPVPAEPYSTIYIGRADPPIGGAEGIAELIDAGNQVANDCAMVDLGGAALSWARHLPPPDYGRAIGAVAAHEMGHLLGLVHVAAADALMSTGNIGKGLDIRRLLSVGGGLSRAPVIWEEMSIGALTLGQQDEERTLLATLGEAVE